MAFDLSKLTDEQKYRLAVKLRKGVEIDRDDVDDFLGLGQEGGLTEQDIVAELGEAGVEEIISEGGLAGKITAKRFKPVKIKPFIPPPPKAKPGNAVKAAPAAPAAPAKGKGKKGKEEEEAPLPKELKAPPEPWASKQSVGEKLRVKAQEKLSTNDIGAVLVEQAINWGDYIPDIKRDSDLQHFIPRPEAEAAFEIFFESKHNLMLIGEAGSGKSTIPKYWAAKKQNLPYLAISADGLLSVNALFGSHHIVNGTSYFIEGLFTTFCQVPSVILIDEVTALEPSKNFVFHQILAERKFFVKDANRTYELHENCLLVFAGNPMNPRYPGVGKMNLAFADRMGTIFLEPLTIAEIKSLFQKNVSDGDITQNELDKLLDYTEQIRDFIKKSPNVKAEFSTRSLKRIVSFLTKKVDFRTAVDWAFINTYTAFDRATFNSLQTVTTNFFNKGRATT